MMGAIGVTVGLIGYLLFLAIGFLEVRFKSLTTAPKLSTFAYHVSTGLCPRV